jgi:TRAP-type transport system small permease protein
MLAALRRLADRLIEAAAAMLLIVLLATVVLGVAGRAVNQPFIWSDELARYLMVWLALVGWIIATRKRAHIRITVFLDLLPLRIRQTLEAAIQVAVVVFGALLVWDGLILVDRNLDIEAVSIPISAAVLYVPIVFAGIATALQALAQIAELFLQEAAPGPTPAGQIPL